MKKLFVMITLSCLIGCTPHSIDDFRAQGNGVMYHLVKELKKVQTLDQLLAVSHRLKPLFNKLVTIMIQARRFQEKHPDRSYLWHPEKNSIAAEKLREQLQRIYTIQGARKVMEEIQKEALHRLDAFEKMNEESYERGI